MGLFKSVEEKGKVVLIIIVVISISVLGIYYFLKLRKESYKIINKKDEVVVKEEKKEEVTEEVKEESNDTWIVDVKGQVVSPGIHKVSKNMRIDDVIKLAGGLTKDADTSLTNLSKKVYDEMVIVVYSKEEVKEILTKEKLSTECGNQEIILNGECSTKKEEINKKININTSSLEELMTIPGIGESKAKAIIEYRTKEVFNTIEDIKKVTGIGDAIFESIKDYITV